MATVLTITDTEILTLARLNLLAGDDAAQAASDVSSVKSYEQEAQENRIAATALGTVALRPLFRRAVAKIIAAEVLEMRARDGSNEGFTGAGVTVAGPSGATDYSRRLREDAERELAPYLLPPPVTPEEASEIALRTAQATKLDAETQTVPTESATRVTRQNAESAKIEAETVKIADERAKLQAESDRITAEVGKLESDAVLAQLKAGVITADEARTFLGRIGAAPVASSLSPQELDARRRAVVNLIDRGLLNGGEAGLSAYLGLPVGVSLARPGVMPVFAPSEPSGASPAAQRRLFGRSEAARFGRAGSDEWD